MSCPTPNKNKYYSKELATKEIKGQNSKARAYFCECDYWHLTANQNGVNSKQRRRLVEAHKRGRHKVKRARCPLCIKIRK